MVFRQLIFEPRAFFSESDGPGSPLWIVLAAATTNAIALAPVYWYLTEIVGGIQLAVVAGFVVVGLLSAFLTQFVEWIVLGGLFHLAATSAGGGGEFRELLGYVGWGYVPAVLRGVVVTLLAAGTLSGAPTDVANPAQVVEALNTQLSPFSRTVGLVTRLWQGMLWLFALHVARDLSLRRAAVIVGLPTLGFVVYNAGAAFGAF